MAWIHSKVSLAVLHEYLHAPPPSAMTERAHPPAANALAIRDLLNAETITPLLSPRLSSKFCDIKKSHQR